MWFFKLFIKLSLCASFFYYNNQKRVELHTIVYSNLNWIESNKFDLSHHNK